MTTHSHSDPPSAPVPPHLCPQVKGLEAEVRLWQEKHAAVQEERLQAEEDSALLSKRLSKAKHGSQENLLDATGTESDVRFQNHKNINSQYFSSLLVALVQVLQSYFGFVINFI